MVFKKKITFFILILDAMSFSYIFYLEKMRNFFKVSLLDIKKQIFCKFLYINKVFFLRFEFSLAIALETLNNFLINFEI